MASSRVDDNFSANQSGPSSLRRAVRRSRGGVGNQLFQYAVGRALSVRTDSTLRLAPSWFSARTPSSTPRRLHLHEFRPRGEFRRDPSREDTTLKARFKLFGLLPTHGPAPTVHCVDCNDGTAVANDLDLMRRCRHQIIANSTLNWWGAWLNRHDEKTVLAPSYWIHDPVEDTDIIPGRWETVGWRSLPGPTNAPSPNGPSPA